MVILGHNLGNSQVSVYRTIGPTLVDWIFFILAGNENIYNISDKFEIWLDRTKDCGVICPCALEKLMYNVVNTLAPLFLIGSSSYWQVMRTSITSRTSLKFGQSGPRTAELPALEGL